MTIGIVLSKPPAYSETFFMYKIKGLQASGYTVKLYVQQPLSEFKLCPVVVAPRVYRSPIIMLGASVITALKLLPYLKRIIRFIRYEKQAKRSWVQCFKNIYTNAHLLSSRLDWVHFGFATMAVQSEHVAKVINAKMAVSLRGFDVAIYPLKQPEVYRLVWQHVNKVHTISDDLWHLATQLGLPNTVAVKKITPAIDVSKWKPKQDQHLKQPYRFLTVARLHWKKGLVPTLEALSLLKQQGMAFKYTIVGEGKEYEPVKFAIHQLQLENDVELLGKLPHNQVIDIMSQNDIYIQYSLSEGFCNAVLEAQAMGLLCVVSNAEGLTENILDNKTGWVVPKNNPALLAKQLQNIISKPQLLHKQILENAHHRVHNLFDVKQQQQQFAKFYETN